jgi:murein peptide amidase A
MSVSREKAGEAATRRRDASPSLRAGATLLALLAPLALAACAGPSKGSPPLALKQASALAPAAPRLVAIGRSVKGREILARVVGSPAAPRRILIVGCVHGNETAGEAITRRLRGLAPPPRVALWLVDEFNPDGCRAHTRQNARGVDLNRNSPWHWRALEAPGRTYYSGPRPLSEPESRAINRLVKNLRPAVSIWYHQHASLVDASSGGSLAIERRYARAVGLPLRYYGVFPGSITSWQNATYPHATAFVVELPAGALPQASLARHVVAIREIAAQLERA